MLRFLLALLMSFNFQAMAKDVKVKEEDRLSYPELEVTPRASERLALEAKREKKKRWFALGPIQFASLMTILASNQAEVDTTLSVDDRDAYEDAQQEALILGSAWFLISTGFGGGYRPYKSGMDDIKNMPTETKRQILTRERIAEEALHAPSQMAKTLKWLSVATLGFANARLITDGDDTSKVVGGVAVLASLAPLAFESRWSSVSRNHKLYKKRIYGPLGSAMLMKEDKGKYALGYGIRYSF